MGICCGSSISTLLVNILSYYKTSYIRYFSQNCIMQINILQSWLYFTIANLKFIWSDPWQRQSFQISNVPAWYHRPDGTSMIARWNIIKEDQDFGTVGSRKSPLIPSPISCCMTFICVSSCQNFFLKVSGVHIDKISDWGTIEYVLRRIVQ